MLDPRVSEIQLTKGHRVNVRMSFIYQVLGEPVINRNCVWVVSRWPVNELEIYVLIHLPPIFSLADTTSLVSCI